MTETKSENLNCGKVQRIAVAMEESEDLLSIIIFCFENVFDWLSLEDLAALKTTCRQLYQMTGEFFQRAIGYDSLLAWSVHRKRSDNRSSSDEKCVDH